MNFDIESTFSKGPGSGFSEGPGLGPGPPYKVCFKNGVLNDWVLFLSQEMILLLAILFILLNKR